MRSRTLPACVYHLAEAANWPSICRSGLLSTKVLLDLADLQGIERERIERYELINSQVFFWLDADRLNRQRRACELRSQVVLVIDARRLAARYAERMSFSPINSGHTRRRPARRGRCTFVPHRLWIESGWSSEADGLGIPPRTYSQRPAELTVAGEAKEAMSCVIEIHRLEPREAFRP